MNNALRTLALTASAVVTVVALAACGSSSEPGSSGADGADRSTPAATGTPASGPHNDADVSFATDMIPHHAQAVTMADMVTASTNADVTSLATDIKAAQDPEIQTMSGWLAGWGAPVPATDGHDMGSMGDSAMPGMMSEQEMTELGDATGTAFDRQWLTLMIAHHEGAIAMSKTELSAGLNAEAKALAQKIIDAQSTEIATMTPLLAALPGS